MAFFDDLKQKVLVGSKQVADKAKEMADITKLKSQIASEKSKMKEAYSILGQMYYEAHKDDPENDDFAAQVAVITTSAKAITVFEEEIERIKAEPDVVVLVPEEVTKEVTPEEASEEAEVIEPVEVKEETKTEKKFCAHCGASVTQDASFCSSCGTPIQ